jgi:hypothetical protein
LDNETVNRLKNSGLNSGSSLSVSPFAITPSHETILSNAHFSAGLFPEVKVAATLV